MADTAGPGPGRGLATPGYDDLDLDFFFWRDGDITVAIIAADVQVIRMTHTLHYEEWCPDEE